jgi:hypothetical protein
MGIKSTEPRAIATAERVEVACACGAAGAVMFGSVLNTYRKHGRGWSCRACQGKRSSDTQRGKRSGADNHFFGQKHSDQTKAQIGDKNRASWAGKSSGTKKEVGERLRLGRISRFGTEASMHVEEIRKKAVAAMTESWQANHDARLEKVKQTNIERYGHEWATLNDEVQQKTIATNLTRYGTERPAQSDEIKQRVVQSFAERYGGNPMHSAEIREKHLNALMNRDSTSAPEREIAAFVESLGFKAVKIHIGGNEPKEIDIHAVGTKFFLEHNGAFYHSDYFPTITPSYHLNKTKQCAKQFGAHLIHIWDYEWENKRPQVHAFLEAKLSKTFQKVRASACEVEEITRDEANRFLDRIHLQGGTHRSFLSLGLKHNGALVAVASFSRPHRQTMDSRPHLSRFAIKPGIRVYGGLSRLSREAFGRIGEFVTFVHFRLSNGSAYRKSGYIFEKFIRPDYMYFDIRNKTMVSKQARKKKAPSSETERELARAEGLYRVYDCGKIKFAFTAASL